MGVCNFCGRRWPDYADLSQCPGCGNNPNYTDCEHGDHFMVIFKDQSYCENCGYGKKE